VSLEMAVEDNGKKSIRLCKEDFMCASVTVRLVHSIIIRPSTQQIRNKQIKYYYINICLLCTATCFDPAGSSSGKYSSNVHSY
jgi:hypothetical protein